MTEYEMADLFVSWGVYQELFLERFIYLLFAFLISSYLVGSKLKPALVTIILVLYSYMALRYVLVYANVIDDQIALAELIKIESELPNSNLTWLEIKISLPLILYTQAAAMFISFLASLAFFYYCRKHDLSYTKKLNPHDL